MPLQTPQQNKKESIIQDVYYFTRKNEQYIATCGDDKIIRIFNISNQECLDQLTFILKGHTKSVISLMMAPNKNYLFSGSRDKTIRV